MEKSGAAIVAFWLALMGLVAEGASPICGIVTEFDFRETNPFAFQTLSTPPGRQPELDKIFVRKLQLFALRAIMDGDFDDYDDGGEEEVENGGSEDTLLLSGNKDNRDWELWTQKKKECRCAKARRENIENTLYMYCGGHSDYHCCPQLDKHGAENLEKCCQKTICKNTGWLHGEEYLHMCYDDWFCG
ncbi:hypothetical protein BSKO_10570 [Bryopsis sp. KO-2023]|nr:hypothetical protein BSKO_10570 [Bryopsis sp. KO-2023]